MPRCSILGRCILLCGLFLFVLLAIGGCKANLTPVGTVQLYTCTDVTITVDYTFDKGVDHKAVYLCNNHKIQWVVAPDVASFEIVFQDPPVGATKNYGTGSGETTSTAAYSAPAELTVYKYTITIVDKNGQSHGPYDPHVVGGGGLAEIIATR